MKKTTKAELIQKLADLGINVMDPDNTTKAQLAEMLQNAEKEENTMTTEETKKEEIAETVTTEETKKEEKPVVEKKAPKRVKKSAENMSAEVKALPVFTADMSIRVNAKGNIFIYVGKVRVFEYCGPTLVTPENTAIAAAVTFEKKDYGCRVAPSAENMTALITAVKKVISEKQEEAEKKEAEKAAKKAAKEAKKAAKKEEKKGAEKTPETSAEEPISETENK